MYSVGDERLGCVYIYADMCRKILQAMQPDYKQTYISFWLYVPDTILNPPAFAIWLVETQQDMHMHVLHFLGNNFDRDRTSFSTSQRAYPTSTTYVRHNVALSIRRTGRPKVTKVKSEKLEIGFHSAATNI